MHSVAGRQPTLEEIMEDQKLTDISGIGSKTADGLAALGVDSIKALTAAPNELIATLPGFSVNRAQQIKDTAAQLVTPTPATPAPVEKAKTTSPLPEKKKKKTKKAKKKSGKKKSPAKKKAAKKPDKKKKKTKKAKKKADKKDSKTKAKKESAKKKKKEVQKETYQERQREELAISASLLDSAT